MNYKNKKYIPKARDRFLLVGLITIVALTTVCASLYSQTKLTSRTDRHFIEDSMKITDEIVNETARYNDILYSGKAYIRSSEHVTQSEWEKYFRDQSILERNPGISAISYVKRFSSDQLQKFTEDARKEKYFGSNFTVVPSGERAEYAVANLAYSNNDLSSAFGFDLFSSSERRAVFAVADKANKPTASPPTQLATGPTGFYVVLPVTKNTAVPDGYVLVSFRAADFAAALLKQNNVQIPTKITDVTNSTKTVDLYASPSWNITEDQLTRSDTLNFGDRTWQITYKSSRAYDDTLLNRYVPRFVLISGGLAILCILLTYLNHQNRRALKVRQ